MKMVIWAGSAGFIIGNLLNLGLIEKAVVEEVYESVAPKPVTRITKPIGLLISSGDLIGIVSCSIAKVQLQETYLSRTAYKLYDAEWKKRVARSWDVWSELCGVSK